jgi:hypothetical protein
MQAVETNHDAQTLALLSLGWALAEQSRAERLLALTGLGAADLRARATDPTCLAAVLGFLEAHEPDLLACAAELAVKPETLVAARRELER